MNLNDKYQRYLELLPMTQDEHGFIDSYECDSLLFTGLTGCLPDVSVDIDKAFDSKTNLWHRRPVSKSCYPDHSKSTISRDMLLGLAWYCYYNNRKDIVEQVINYAFSNWGIMGEAKTKTVLIGRCFIGPGLLATYAWILYKLGGKDYWWLRMIPADFGYGLKGFQAHLQVLHILLRYKLTGKLSRGSRAKIAKHVKREPRNPLFLYVDGQSGLAKDMLMTEEWWPSDRLPTRADRKSNWLPMRDYGSDWKPSDVDPGRTHSGGDFLFVAGLILGKI